jgi:hypothetical protein
MLTAAAAESGVPAPFLVCEGCGSSQVRASLGKRRGDKEKALNGKRPYRCLSCGLRFYSAACSDAQKSARRTRTFGRRIRSSWKHNRSFAVRMGVFLVMLLMFLLCLLFLTRYKPDNSSSRGLTPRPGVYICRDASCRAKRLPRHRSVVS